MTAQMAEKCVLCGMPALGYGRNAEGGRLCHHEARDCYTQWTRDGVRIILPARTSTRACYFCGKVLSAHAGFIETVHQPDGLRRDFCSAECLHWQLHEDEKAE